LSEFFNVSIDELIKGKNPQPKVKNDTIEIEYTKTKKTERNIIFFLLKIAGITIGGLLLIDIIVMIIYFLKNGFPPL